MGMFQEGNKTESTRSFAAGGEDDGSQSTAVGCRVRGCRCSWFDYVGRDDALVVLVSESLYFEAWRILL